MGENTTNSPCSIENRESVWAPCRRKIDSRKVYGCLEQWVATYSASPLADDSTFSFSGMSWMFNYNDNLPETNFIGIAERPSS